MDETSKLLGQIAAQNEIMMTQQDELYRELNAILEQNVELRTQLVEINFKQEILEKKFEEITPDLKFLANIKQRGIGIVSVLGFAFAALGYYFEKLFKQ